MPKLEKGVSLLRIRKLFFGLTTGIRHIKTVAS